MLPTDFEENSDYLCFTDEFENAETLLISEVRFLLQHREDTKDEDEDDDSFEMSEVFTSVLDYCNTFSKYKTRETVAAVRRVLGKCNVHKFERAQLANLCPSTVTQTKALIPSLSDKLSDEEIAAIIDDMEAKTKFQL